MNQPGAGGPTAISQKRQSAGAIGCTLLVRYLAFVELAVGSEPVMEVVTIQRRAGIVALLAAGLEAIVRGTSLYRMMPGEAERSPPLPIDWVAYVLIVGLSALGAAWLLSANRERKLLGAGIVASMGALAAATLPATLVAINDIPAERGLLVLGMLTGIVVTLAGGFACVSLIIDPKTSWTWPLSDPPMGARTTFLGSALVLAVTINPQLTDAAHLASGVGLQTGVDLALRQLPLSQVAFSLLGLVSFAVVGVVASGLRPVWVTVGAGILLAAHGGLYVYDEVAFSLGWTTGREPAPGAVTSLTVWFWLHVIALAGLVTSTILQARSSPPTSRRARSSPARAAG